MTKKYDTLKTIQQWCKRHPSRDFFHYYEVGINTRSIAALCDVPFKGRVWLARRGVSEKRGATHGLVKYALSSYANTFVSDGDE